jgi:hypothetical protein
MVVTGIPSNSTITSSFQTPALAAGDPGITCIFAHPSTYLMANTAQVIVGSLVNGDLKIYFV